jgi:diguanylate cyclase (GGDEF)-like protein
VKENKSHLEASLMRTTALYDVAKDICASLQEEEVFAIFKERIVKYLKVGDCQFLGPEASFEQYKDYILLPLVIDKDSLGYLAVRGVRQEQMDEFRILTEQFLLGMKRSLLYKKVQELAIIDGLTQVLNRRCFMDKLAQEAIRSEKFNYKLSFLMLDLDHFKTLNDSWGHLAGDVVLKEICSVIKDNIRQVDFVGRWGGEEFALVLPETDMKQAKIVAERIRRQTQLKHIKAYGEELKVTLSIGIAIFPDDSPNIEKLIDQADQALYRAKQAGRNRVCS